MNFWTVKAAFFAFHKLIVSPGFSFVLIDRVLCVFVDFCDNRFFLI